ncbi:MAG: alanine--tRNA ligase [Anaerolineae bacterium]|jgi:alanyl-tRNA synthetase
MLTSTEIRTRFLEFFRQRGHTIVKSSSLVPGNDPTLLFTNAGMVQFKEIYLGLETRPYARAASSQKCMRVSGKHNDLENVGPSSRHHTFFEMLGNFSFGDYFKEGAIKLAWEFLTVEMGMDPDRLYPTIYLEDDEAHDIWVREIGLDPARITRLGRKDNFWEMAETGPCGPDSEIIYDRGPAYCTCHRDDCSPATDCERWLEIWNLVFTQFDQQADGTLVPLTKRNIDTGMGLERLTSVLQGVDNNYDTDVFLPIMRRTQELLGHSDEQRLAQMVPYRVIADHSRAIAFLIADGVLPGNEGRNYVLRLVLRRAARFGRRLGFRGPFLAETCDAVIDKMGAHYTELVERRDFIRQVVTNEEERFLLTLDTGLARLEQVAGELRTRGATVVPGIDAFRLYDTYGFPLEMTRDAAAELGLSVDEDGFQRAMDEQRERARSSQRFAADNDADLYRVLGLPPSHFVGYERCSADATVVSLVADGRQVAMAPAGARVQVVLDVTPFYAESGGQVGDTGLLSTATATLQVHNTTRPAPDIIVHHAQVLRGEITAGDRATARVDEARRLDIARNHSATHLLHRALRHVLGEHAAQSGSLVAPERLRFDFSHLAPLTPEQLEQVQTIVNAEIRANRPISTQVLHYDEALAAGAIALFGEKYGDEVRAVSTEGFTTELCGGTHVQATGQIGLFLIVSESSIGSGLRRIEALTGRGAEAHVNATLKTLSAIGQAVSARAGEELERVRQLEAQVRELRRELHEAQQQLAARDVDRLLDLAEAVGQIRVLAQVVAVPDVDALRDMVDRFRDKLGSAVVALGAVVEGRPLLIVGLTNDLVQKGLNAGKLAGDAARLMGGGGGGRPNMAQAGGRDADKLAEAVAAVASAVKSALSA